MNGTILIISEDVNAQIIAETLLRLRGHQVRLAGYSPPSGYTSRREDVALVVLDVSLPGTDNSGLLRRLHPQLRSTLAGKEPRFLIVADAPAGELTNGAARLGVDAVLLKPFTPREFINAVEALVKDRTPQAA